jgi:ribosome-binding protein aMBF1 (putative translation factor)
MKCEICGKTCTSKSGLSNHKRATHNILAPCARCGISPKATYQNSKNPYCKPCQHAYYAQKSALKNKFKEQITKELATKLVDEYVGKKTTVEAGR